VTLRLFLLILRATANGKPAAGYQCAFVRYPFNPRCGCYTIRGVFHHMRKFTLFAAAAATALTLSACSEKTQDSAATTAESAGNDVANAADQAAAATDELGSKAAAAVDDAAAKTDEMADKAAAKTKQEAAEAEASLHNESVAEAKKD
jgi:hypothetical protein